MRFCPKCGVVYVSSGETCDKCDAPTTEIKIDDELQERLFEDVPIDKARQHLSFLQGIYTDAVKATDHASNTLAKRLIEAQTAGQELINYFNQLNGSDSESWLHDAAKAAGKIMSELYSDGSVTVEVASND